MEDRFHVFLCKPTIFCGIITVVSTQTLLLWIICLQDCLFHMFVLLCMFHLCSVVFSCFFCHIAVKQDLWISLDDTFC